MEALDVWNLCLIYKWKFPVDCLITSLTRLISSLDQIISALNYIIVSVVSHLSTHSGRQCQFFQIF